MLPDELYADLVLLGGKIATIDPDDSVVEEVAATLNKMEFEALKNVRALEICDLIRTELGVT